MALQYQATWRNAGSCNAADGYSPFPARASFGEASADASLAAAKDSLVASSLSCPVEHRVVAKDATTGELVGDETIAVVWP